MAQTGYTPILIYSSSTAAQAPAAGNLTNSTLGSELAINITDGKLFYKDNANAVQVIAWKVTPTTAGGTGLTSYTAGDLLYYATGTTLAKLTIGASTTVLTSSGTAPQWTAQSALSVGEAANLKSNATTGVMQITGPGAGTTRVMTIPNANFTAARTDAGQTFTGNQTVTGNLTVQNSDNTQTTLSLVNGTGYNLSTLTNFVFGAVNSSSVDGGRTYQWNVGISGGALGKAITWSTVDTTSGTVERFRFTPEGNIQPAAAKGVNFTANTPAAGMTSQLLNWYEEGTWTPSIGGNATYNNRSGYYTRIGRQVTAFFLVQVNVKGTGSADTVSGLPFTISSSTTIRGGGSIQYFGSVAVNTAWLSPVANSNTTTFSFIGQNAVDDTCLDAIALFQDGTFVIGSIVYFV